MDTLHPRSVVTAKGVIAANNARASNTCVGGIQQVGGRPAASNSR
jgi:hypothetical protein